MADLVAVMEAADRFKELVENAKLIYGMDDKMPSEVSEEIIEAMKRYEKLFNDYFNYEPPTVS